jgi:hypothetical protein
MQVIDYPSEEAFVAIRNEDWPLIKKAIDDAIAPFKPRGWRKALFLLREWGVLGAIAAIIVGLLAIAAGAIYQATARIEKQTRFQTETEGALKEIRASIIEIKAGFTKQSLSTHAALPLADFKASLSDLGSSIAAARKQNLKVPPKIVDDLIRKMTSTDKNTPAFWPVAAELISYRSLTLATPFIAALPNCTDSLPTVSRIIEVPNPKTAKVGPGIYENCRITLDSEEENKRINSILSDRNPSLSFKHCLVIYRGGPVNLILSWNNRPVRTIVEGKEPSIGTVSVPNTLSFEECLFDFSFQGIPPPNGQQITETLLAQNGHTVTFPHP